ncbi:Sec1-like protein [Gongronella butleri]|nr:Sec1-like protein [Gongronella butleri]
MYVDYQVVESNVFSVDPPSSFFSVFGTDRRAYPESSLQMTAKQLLSLCVTLGEDPIIRYQSPPEVDGQPPLPFEGATKSLALALQRELDRFCQLNPNFPPRSSQPRATFLIVDRTVDQYAPLLHEFTYQAMINDLLPVKPTENGTGIVYSYEFTQADGSLGTKDVVLDEDDHVYTSIRHLHIAECTDRLIEEFNKFLAENKQDGKADPDAPKATARSLNDMKEMLTNLPHFQEMKAKYSAHLSIAQECMSYFEKSKLNSVGNLEQNIATGETPDGEVPKTIVLDMVPLLDDKYISDMDKTRLLMQYIISKDGGVFEDDKRKLFDHAHLARESREAIDNLSLMGVQVTRQRRAKGEKSTRKRFLRKRANRDDDQPYELSRYIPVIKKTMDAFFTHQLDDAQFAYCRASDKEHDGSDPATKAVTNQLSGVSLRTTRPTYRSKQGANGEHRRTASGSKLVIFVIGGLTYSEIRSTYEMAELYNRDIFIGTTEILRPTKYVENLSQLRMSVPRDPVLIPAYTAPPPKSSSSSLKPLIPKLSHSSSHASLNASSMSSSPSIPPTAATDETKKKKKGLKKLFG